MVSYVRNYASRPCIKCEETIESPRGPQRYCETCRTTCEVEGCTNVVRAGGKCTTHAKAKFEVASLEPIAGQCGVVGCGRVLKQKGMCSFHYGRAYHYGDVGDVNPRKSMPVGARCLVDGCGKPSVGRGYCQMHYARFRTKGDAGSAELLIGVQGGGSITPTGYRVVVIDGEQIYEHRHVLERKLGRKLLPGENAHHMDGDKLNNDPSNLELWSRYQPSGQRVEDKVRAALALIDRYPEVVESIREEQGDIVPKLFYGFEYNAYLGFAS